MATISAIQNKCIHHCKGSTFFNSVTVGSMEDLRALSDSVLRMNSIEDAERLAILETVAFVCGDVVPRMTEVVYAFDVDGTLTPHAGSDPQGLWHLGPDEYYRSLTLEQRDQMIYRLMCLPTTITLISRNREENVVRLLYLLNSKLPDRISRNSSFRSSGVCPTGISKKSALQWLVSGVYPVVYADDSLEEINICRSVGGVIHSYHAQNWLGDPVEWGRFVSSIPHCHVEKGCYC